MEYIPSFSLIPKIVNKFMTMFDVNGVSMLGRLYSSYYVGLSVQTAMHVMQSTAMAELIAFRKAVGM